MVGHELYDPSLEPIPGYGGKYLINKEGIVTNQCHQVLTPYKTKHGDAVELRYLGQRDRVLITDLLKRLEDKNEAVRAD